LKELFIEKPESKGHKSIQLDHPLNRVSEKLFEDSVNKLFSFTAKTPDEEDLKSDNSPVFTVNHLQLEADGSLNPQECI
jgi:hypothetical protein